MNDFSFQLQNWRLSKGLTHQQLAQVSGVPRPNIVALEQGKRECTLKTLHHLAKALGITAGSLLEESPPPIFTLDRFERDQLVRYLLNLSTTSGPKITHAAKALSPLVRPILGAAGIPRKVKGPKGRSISPTQAKMIFGEAVFKELVRRCNKLAA